MFVKKNNRWSVGNNELFSSVPPKPKATNIYKCTILHRWFKKFSTFTHSLKQNWSQCCCVVGMCHWTGNNWDCAVEAVVSITIVSTDTDTDKMEDMTQGYRQCCRYAPFSYISELSFSSGF